MLTLFLNKKSKIYSETRPTANAKWNGKNRNNKECTAHKQSMRKGGWNAVSSKEDTKICCGKSSTCLFALVVTFYDWTFHIDFLPKLLVSIACIKAKSKCKPSPLWLACLFVANKCTRLLELAWRLRPKSGWTLLYASSEYI